MRSCQYDCVTSSFVMNTTSYTCLRCQVAIGLATPSSHRPPMLRTGSLLPGFGHSHMAALARAERQGRYRPPASTPTPWPNRPGGPAYEPADVEALLDELKGAH